MRHYANAHIASCARFVATLAPLIALAALVLSAPGALTSLTITPRLNDLDLSASTDGEDAGVVVAELATFVDAEAVFAADSALAPVCAARALR